MATGLTIGLKTCKFLQFTNIILKMFVGVHLLEVSGLQEQLLMGKGNILALLKRRRKPLGFTEMP